MAPLHSRRDALKLLGAGAATAAAGPIELPEVHSPFHLAEYFSLREVRLGEGPFLAAQKLDEAYLLRLEPDRMLHNFRVNAGLAPKAPVYGGWESVEPWVWIRCHGHTAGHYLTAAACMFESTDDPRFAERVDYIVSELAECQARTGGWLCAFPDGVAPLLDSLAGREFAGVPWYTTHKVLAGLRDAHLHRGSPLARDVLVKFATWIDGQCRNVPQDRFQKMLDREHGGMNEVLGDVAAISGDGKFLDLARRFNHEALLRPLLEGRDTLDGLHANTQIPKVIGFERLHELNGGASGAADPALFFWQTVTRNRSFATGGHGDVEHFFPMHEFPKHLGSGKTMETCCTHNMLRLTRLLYQRDPWASFYDYYERALFNGILASQDPETGMNTYFQSTRPGYLRLYHTPFDSFWCCTGSGIENHARYADSIYAHDAGTLFVNLFLESTLDWRERGLTLRQQTRFPDSDTTRLTVGGRAQRFTLALRKPAWCEEMSVTINGRKAGSLRGPSAYLRIARRFRAGDVIEVRLPMALHLEPLPNAPEYAALMYGPIVLGGRLGTEGIAPGTQLIVNERESGNMLQADVKIPRWDRPIGDLVSHASRTHPEKLEFRLNGFEGGAAIDLIPWFRLTHERYNLYWRRSA